MLTHAHLQEAQKRVKAVLHKKPRHVLPVWHNAGPDHIQDRNLHMHQAKMGCDMPAAHRVLWYPNVDLSKQGGKDNADNLFGRQASEHLRAQISRQQTKRANFCPCCFPQSKPGHDP